MKFLSDTLNRLRGDTSSDRSESDLDLSGACVPDAERMTGRTHAQQAQPKLSRKADPVEVAATRPILEMLSAHLRSTAADLQESVLEISSGFSGMAARARETVQIAHSGLHSADGVDADSTIQRISSVLESLLTTVLDSSRQSARLAGRIRELEDVLTQVNASLKRVEKISEEARIVGLNGRLEAARAGSHGAAFNVVANETKNLGLHASETSSSIRGLVSRLDESLQSVSAELSERVTSDAKAANDSQDTVSALLEQLRRLHFGMMDSLRRTETVSESLSRDIGRAVMALQFQDRVNQRLDHACDALLALQENLKPFDRQAPADRVEARSADWRRWLDSRCTMQVERELVAAPEAAVGSGSSDSGSVELF